MTPRLQRHLCSVLVLVLLTYAVMTPAAMASMWLVNHASDTTSAAPSDCHEAPAESPEPDDPRSSGLPCCKGLQCSCFISPPGLMFAGNPEATPIPSHSGATPRLETFNPRALRESPLRPPNA